MLGFVAVLASALLGIVLVFVIMLVSFISAQLAPTMGDYKHEVEGGLLFPVDSFLLSDEVMEKAIARYREIKGDHPIELSTTCSFGERLDKFTSDRYTSYNYIFLTSVKEVDKSVEDTKALPPKFNKKLNRCVLVIRDADYVAKMKAKSGAFSEEIDLNL